MNGIFSQLNSSEAAHAFEIIEKQKRLIFLLDEEIGRLSNTGETDLSLTPEYIDEVITAPPSVPHVPTPSPASVASALPTELLAGHTMINVQVPLIELATAVLMAGGRLKSNTFNEDDYLARNPDVAASIRAGQYGSGFEHWLLFGLAEGRAARFASDNGDLKDRTKSLQTLNSYRQTKSLRLRLRQRLGRIYRSLLD